MDSKVTRELHNSKESRIINDKVNNNTKTIWIGRVVIVDDDLDGRSLKVRVKGLDDKIINNVDLPSAYPLLPKLIDAMPKIGEAVRIIIPDVKYPYSERIWVGPIISKYQKYKEDPFFTALDGLEGSAFDKLTDPIGKIPTAKNSYPKKEDVNIHGRDNSDLVLKENGFILRNNKHKKNKIEEDSNNPAYIQGSVIENSDGTNESILSYVADQLLLISHKGDLKVNPFITEKDIKNLKDKAHPVAKADVLVSLLKVLITVTLNHSHSYNGQPLIKTSDSEKLKEFNLENILNNFIKVN